MGRVGGGGDCDLMGVVETGVMAGVGMGDISMGLFVIRLPETLSLSPSSSVLCERGAWRMSAEKAHRRVAFLT